jgi:magnesium transporter
MPIRRRSKKSGDAAVKRGLAPGVAVFTGEPTEQQVRVWVIRYTERELDEREQVAVEDCARIERGVGVTWVNVDGVHQVEVVSAVCRHFGVHPLALEDILNPGTRPKIEAYEDHVLAVLRGVEDASSGRDAPLEHYAVVLGEGFVLTFQERQGDPWDAVRRRLRTGTGRMRRSGPDHLFHALIDAVVDGYLAMVNHFEDRVDELDAAAVGGDALDLPSRVHALKSELMILRRAVAPLRDTLSVVLRGEVPWVGTEALPFFRDLQDHLVLALDGLDGARDRAASAVELHLAASGHRLNEIMRFLTVMSSVFIPLTFLAGVEGMNFRHMPELERPWGYPAALGVMGLIALSMLAWFRRRRWI